MNALAFASRSLVRQPARAALGILGVAAVGALLFDMLLLSHGLIVSMRDLLDRTGYDVRVTATDDLPRSGPLLQDVRATVATLSRLPSVHDALAVRFVDAEVNAGGNTSTARDLTVSLEGVASGSALRSSRLPWSVLTGRDLERPGEVVIDRTIATGLGVSLGGAITIRASCGEGTQALPPVRLRVVGVAEFPFEATSEHTAGVLLETIAAACGDTDATHMGGADDNGSAEQADMILVRSTGDPDATVAAIRAVRPDLGAATNEQMLGRIQQTGFTYFQQISAVLTTVTLSFAVLLITVLLTVSVNQRLGQIAALRAVGFSRSRVVLDVLCESALIVGSGGLLSLPLGALLAVWLDRILKRMPGIPAQLHFFVYEDRALVIHLALLFVTALVAALYPMRLVARLPIAATLRSEVTG